MSNTTLTPTVAAATLAGVAGAMGLAVAPLGGGAAVAGVGPTATAVSPVVSREGLPVSWTLGAGAAGASIGPIAWQQIRLSVSGPFGSDGALVVQGSHDNSVWSVLAAVNSAGVIVVSANDVNRYAYLRPAVQGGDGTTAIAVVGNVSTTGCV